MNNANLDPLANLGLPPQDDTRKPVAIMLTAETHAASLEIARRIAALPELHEKRAEEIKQRVKAELQALDKEFSEVHDAEWGALQIGLGLDKELNYSLCTDHLDAHGVAFVTEQVDEPSGLPTGLDIGSILAKALGGRMVSGDENGGVIEVRR